MILTYEKLGKNGRFGNQLFQIASTIGTAYKMQIPYAFPVWEYQKYFEYELPILYGFENPQPMNGYLQDYKFFDDCKATIRHYFTMKPLEVDKHDEVFIHFRAYSNEGVTNFHPEQTKEYYEKAVQQFEGKKFIVFADDIQKARKVLPSEYLFHKGNEIEDFYMMTKCSGAIISNSTFAWWAAWLQNKKTIIPTNWFTSVAPYDSKGLYMPNWIAL